MIKLALIYYNNRSDIHGNDIGNIPREQFEGSSSSLIKSDVKDISEIDNKTKAKEVNSIN